MIPQHIDSETLWLLSAIRETGSLSLAAKKTDVSLATAARTLARARKLLNDRLFVRGRDGFVPTLRLEALLPEIRAAERALVELARTDRFEPQTLRATIRIGCVDNAAFMFVLPFLGELYREAPGIRLELLPLPENPAEALESGALDIVFYAPPLKQNTGLRAVTLFRTAHVLVVRKAHPILARIEAARRAGKPLPTEALDDYREIELLYGPGSTRRAGETSAPPDASQNIAIVSAFFVPAAFMLLETDFYVRLPVPTAERLKAMLPLETLPAGMRKLPDWEGKILWHARTDFDPALSWFRSRVAQALRRPSTGL